MKFSEFGFTPSLMEGIEAMGFETPTPIQQQAIPAILEGRDIIGSAQTGTGKTAAFLLPVIQNIIANKRVNKTRALIIVPTRELAQQIDQQMEGFGYFTPVGSIAVYGGGDGALFAREKKALSEGTEVVICTPGRMIAHLNNNYVKFDGLEYLILDEADRMLDMGFHEDIMKIIQYIPNKRQNLMFAATMPKDIRTLARKVLNDPVEISIAISKPVEKILQVAYPVYETQKLPLAIHLLKGRNLKSVIVFCSTKISAKQLGRQLKREGLKAEDIHSDLTQKERGEIMLQFRNRKLNILVATDLLSRGIDIDNIELIINYDVPHEGEDYIHRIGRTARADTDGIAITLISQEEQYKFARIEKLLEKEVTKSMVPEELGETPEYNPDKNRGRGGGGGRNFKGKGSGGNRHKGNRSGGNRSGDKRSGGGKGRSGSYKGNSGSRK
ncbi:MAG: DEAD/DEAH box helicase [Bacteroidetes bacterium]|nr:DEAD/DEAH box helicase [Bacteroidota bacterium]